MGIFQKLKKTSLREFLEELRWILKLSGKHKGEIILYTLCGLGAAGLSLAASLLSKYIIDGATGYHAGAITMPMVFYGAMQLLRILTNAFTSRVSAKVSIRVHNRITAQVYEKLLGAQWESISRYHSGDLLSRLGGDVSSVSSGVLGIFPDLITRLLQLIGTLGIILYYDPLLALFSLLSAPVTILSGRVLMGKMRQFNKKMRKNNSDLLMFTEESFQNIQLLKAFDLTDEYNCRLTDMQELHKKDALDYNLHSINQGTLMKLAATGTALLCLVWCLFRLRRGLISYGTMTLFLHLASSLSTAFSALIGMIPSTINAATAAGRIMAITTLPAEEKSTPPESLLKNAMETGVTITAENLSYGYDGHKAVLSDLSFTIAPGQILGIVGPSGEGKTTLLRLLLGIVRPTSGSLTATAGEETTPLDENTRRLFSYVPQKCTMFTGTIRENLLLVKKDATDEELFVALELACAADFVRKKPQGLDTPIKEQGTGLSQGQLQRLCIARALLCDAPVLLLDEATSALDMETEQKVLQNIMQSRPNRTLLVTTHRPSVLSLCHRTYRIQNNTLTE